MKIFFHLKSEAMKNILLILFTVLVYAVPNNLTAQYSNASFNGPWILHSNDYSYIIFDGNGTVNALGISKDSVFPVGTYNVLANGSFTATVNLTNGANSVTGNLITDSTATFMINGQGSFTEFRVDNPGALADTLTGTIYDSTSLVAKNIKVTVNSSGAAAFAGGDLSGLTGKIFAQADTFAGYFTSTDTGCIWKRIQIEGTYLANTLQGTVQFGKNDNSSCASYGSVQLTRTSAVSNGITHISAGTNFCIYPNPSSVGSWQLLVGNELIGAGVQVFDMSGRLLFKSEIRNPQSEITWNEAVSNGAYLLNITSSAYSITKLIVKN